MKFGKKEILFCELNPFCYKLSLQKEILKRHLKDAMSKERIAHNFQEEKLPCVVYSYSSNMIKRAPGVDLSLQENKAVNLKIASNKINGIIINPGETFSFWKIVGKTTKKKGYKDGRVIRQNKLIPGTGGGLCNLGNIIHLLVLHSPLKVTEFHKHSDALAPEEKRIPLSAGTSVSYNNLDFRFKNITNQKIQLVFWSEGDKLYAEIRSEKEFPCNYKIVEENHHFKKEGAKYFRNSKIFREIFEKKTGDFLHKELIWDNHSEVMYDYSLIPKNLIKK